ncbi:MAG TPA: alpha/beta fold hydrolase, partial [Planctomycetaceae bacterium]|nr:alpha/beta fold hydrolase [Planctomycetaceae bacterium]
MSPIALITAIVAVLGLEVYFQYLALKCAVPIFESSPPLEAELFPPDPAAEPLTIATRDGVELAGSLLRTSHETPRGLILFCHEFNSNRWSAFSYGEGLLAAGFHLLTFDFRNQGDSRAAPGYFPIHWATEFEVEDVRAAVRAIEGRADLRDLPLGIFGISRGGSAALVAAAECPEIRCVAVDGAYACIEMLLHYTKRWGRLYFPEFLLRLMPRWHILTSLWLVRWV